MKRLTIKQHNFLIILLLCFVIGVISLFIITPSYRNITALERDIAENHNQLDNQLLKIRRLRRSLSEFHVIKAATKVFTKASIKKGEALSIIDEVESLAPEYGIKQVVSVDVKKEGNVSRYTFSFVNQGTFDNHITYIRALEKLPYYVIIDRLQWELKDRSDTELTVRFTGTIYENYFTK